MSGTQAMSGPERISRVEAEPALVSHPLHVGALVRERRRALGLRQKDLALAAGVHYLWIKKLEQGRDRLDFGRVLRALGALNIDLVLVAHDAPLPHAPPHLKKRLPRPFTRGRAGIMSSKGPGGQP